MPFTALKVLNYLRNKIISRTKIKKKKAFYNNYSDDGYTPLFKYRSFPFNTILKFERSYNRHYRSFNKFEMSFSYKIRKKLQIKFEVVLMWNLVDARIYMNATINFQR